MSNAEVKTVEEMMKIIREAGYIEVMRSMVRDTFDYGAECAVQGLTYDDAMAKAQKKKTKRQRELVR